eukprot:scaffold12.g7923.t1
MVHYVVGVSTVARITRILEEVKVEEKALDSLPFPNISLVQGVASGIDLEGKNLLLAGREPLPYDRLAICAGAAPKGLSGVSAAAAASGRVLTLRDTDSVGRLGAALAGARRVVVVGNGGIAMQIIHGLRGVDVHQRTKEQREQVAAGQEQRQQRQQQHEGEPRPQQQAPSPGGEQRHAAPAGKQPYSIQTMPGRQPAGGPMLGHAVGPHWLQHLPAGVLGGTGGRVALEYGCELAEVDVADAAAVHEQQGKRGQQEGVRGQQQQDSGTSVDAAPAGADADGCAPWPLRVALTSGKRLGADLVVAAIGVSPALGWVPPALARAPDGGLMVNRDMQTSDPSVYAAGDSCSAAWALEDSPHWFQMRLWSQARSMGLYSAACMAGRQDDSCASMAFEMFTHATRFLGKKVVLLGLYNGQRLEGEPAEELVSYSRVTEGPTHHGGCCRPGAPARHAHGGEEGRTFVRVLLLRGRVQGAVLIGETDLEETFENLILDQLDVGCYGPALLDPEVELDHVFD